MFKDKKTHPSYGILGFSRVNSNYAHPLFGSSIKHRDTIRLRLKRCEQSRELNKDWYFGKETLFEVEMSLNQFSELITSMNCGEGVPVTILRTENDYDVPECPFEDKAELHLSEFKQHLNTVYQDSRELIQNLKELFSSKKTLTKKDKEEIISALTKISQNIGTNQSYQLNQFQEQMENTTTEAKAEVEAFYQNRMMQIKQINNNEDTEQLPIIEM